MAAVLHELLNRNIVELEVLLLQKILVLQYVEMATKLALSNEMMEIKSMEMVVVQIEWLNRISNEQEVHHQQKILA